MNYNEHDKAKQTIKAAITAVTDALKRELDCSEAYAYDDRACLRYNPSASAYTREHISMDTPSMTTSETGSLCFGKTNMWRGASMSM